MELCKINFSVFSMAHISHISSRNCNELEIWEDGGHQTPSSFDIKMWGKCYQHSFLGEKKITSQALSLSQLPPNSQSKKKMNQK
jgi:hypothetical protein